MQELQSIEIQPLLLALAGTVVIVLVISVLFLYCPSSSAERPFSQPELTSEVTSASKTKAEKKQKKKQKKKDQKGGSGKLLQLEIDAQVMGEDIPSSQPSSPDDAQDNKKRQKKGKSILLNKDEPVNVTDETVEYPHVRLELKPPSDEVELHHKEQQEHNYKGKKAVQVEEIIQSSSAHVQAAAPPEGKKKKKSDEVGEISESDLTKTIREAVLPQSDVERLIGLLLEKTTGTPHSIVQKFGLTPDDSNPSREQELRQKAEERRNQLERDLARVKAKSQQRESEAAAANEQVSKLQTILQQTIARHDQTQAHAHETHTSQLTRLQDENQQLSAQLQERTALHQASQQELKVMQTSLSDSVMKMNASDRARQAVEARLKQMEQHKVDENPAIQQELQSLRAQLASLQQELISSKQALEKVETSRQQVSMENARLSQDMQQIDIKKQQVLKQALNDQQSLQAKVHQLEMELRLQQEASRRELASHKQTSSRKEVELQQVSSSRDSLEQQLKLAEEQTQRAMADMQSKLDRQAAEMSEITVEREQQAVAEMSSLQTEIASLKSQLHIASNALLTSESVLTTLQQEKAATESETQQLRQQLASIDQDNKSRESEADELKRQVNDVTKELDISRTTVNELREDQWKLKEELSRITRDRDEQILISQKQHVSTALDNERAEFRSAFQRVFPQFKDFANLTHDEWIKEFPLQVMKLGHAQPDTGNKKELEGVRKQLKESESSNEELSHKNTELQSLLQTTEKALSQLEGHVTSELKTFEGKLAEKDKLIAQIQQKLSEVQKSSETTTTNNDLEEQLSKMTVELSTSEAQCTDLQTQLVGITADNAQLQMQLDSAQQKLKQLAQVHAEGVNGTAEEETSTLRGEIKNLTDALSREKTINLQLQKRLRRDSSCSSSDDGPINPGLKGIVDDVLIQDL